MIKIVVLLGLFFFSFLVTFEPIFGDQENSIDSWSSRYYGDETNYKIIFHDLSQVDFQLLEVNKHFIPKWIDEPRDFSDILQIKFKITNKNLENFVIYKNMFQIDVIDPRIKQSALPKDFVVDNYYPQYIEDFKLRFQDIDLPQSLFDCELLNEDLKINRPKTLSVCFDVKQKWTNYPLDLNGPLLYYLVMMDNKFTTSCPNCKAILLNNFTNSDLLNYNLSPKILVWLNKLKNWESESLISNKEFSSAINYLEENKIIEKQPTSIGDLFPQSKSKEKSILTMVDFREHHFNEGDPIVFEGHLLDYLGNPIQNAKIQIKSDGLCPSDHIIAEGTTDKKGRYKILTSAIIYDELDNLVRTVAEFPGTDDFEKSVSDPQLIVIYPLAGTKCLN